MLFIVFNSSVPFSLYQIAFSIESLCHQYNGFVFFSPLYVSLKYTKSACNEPDNFCHRMNISFDDFIKKKKKQQNYVDISYSANDANNDSVTTN